MGQSTGRRYYAKKNMGCDTGKKDRRIFEFPNVKMSGYISWIYRRRRMAFTDMGQTVFDYSKRRVRSGRGGDERVRIVCLGEDESRANCLEQLIKKYRIARLAVEMEVFSAALYRRILQIPGIQIEGLDGVLEEIRSIKTPEEIHSLRCACNSCMQGL